MAGWFADTAGGRRQLGGNSMQKTYDKKFGKGIKFSYSYGKDIETHFHRDQNDLKKLMGAAGSKAFSESTFAKTMKGSADASFHASVTLGGSTSLYGGVRFQTNPLQGTGGVTLDSKIKSVLYLSLEFGANLHVQGQVASNAPITPTWKTKAALFAFFVGVKIKCHHILYCQCSRHNDHVLLSRLRQALATLPIFEQTLMVPVPGGSVPILVDFHIEPWIWVCHRPPPTL